MDSIKNKFKLKEEQQLAIEAVCGGRNVFAVLPTGFGKSLLYLVTPLVLDEVSFLFVLVFSHTSVCYNIYHYAKHM